MTKRVHIVPHTHWDREWYLTFQEFRIYLVRLVDRLLGIMRDDDYTHFMLDGQTVAIEDYLEVRPEQQAELAALVQSGRLSIGPWYVLPDLFLVSGESLIRNLRIGRRTAGLYGGSMQVGYMPDQFGFPTQMPQILAGLGLDAAVVWRGFDSATPTEIWWEAPDGSRVLAHKLEAKLGYFNAADLNLDSPQVARQQIDDAVSRIALTSSTDVVLLMNGVDHKFPDGRLPKMIDALNEAAGDESVRQSSLTAYFDALRGEPNAFPIMRGEQRDSEMMEMLQGTLSTRMYLKQENERAETLLAFHAEPLSVFAWLLGAEYPSALLDFAWKELIRNHAHDSMCGCSLDEVHREMITRFSSVSQVGCTLVEHATKRIADSLSGDADTERVPSVLIINTLPWKRSGLVDVELHLPTEDESWREFHLLHGERLIPYTVVEEDDLYVAFNPGEALDSFPAYDSCRKVVVRLLATDLPAWGYAVLDLKAGKREETSAERLQDFTNDAGLPGVRIDSLELSFNPDGTFDLLDLRSGEEYRGMHYFEDGGDCGDEYSYCPPADDQIITTLHGPAHVELETEGPDFRSFVVAYEMAVPARVERYGRVRRSAETTMLQIRSKVTVTAGVSRIDVATEVENTARDHRLRVLFPTDVCTDLSFSETAFDVVEREIAPAGVEGWMEDPQPTHPQLNFAGAASPGRGLTVANLGLTEYELRDDSRRTFALTLLRCVEWGSRGDLTNTRRAHKENGAPGHNYMFTPEAQCQGSYTFEYSLIAHKGDPVTSGAAREAYNYKVFLVAHQRKLSPQVAASGEFVRVHVSESVIPGTMKLSDDSDRCAARFVNLSKARADLTLGLGSAISEASLLDLAENPTQSLEQQSGQDVELDVPPKRILTLGLKRSLWTPR